MAKAQTRKCISMRPEFYAAVQASARIQGLSMSAYVEELIEKRIGDGVIKHLFTPEPALKPVTVPHLPSEPAKRRAFVEVFNGPLPGQHPVPPPRPVETLVPPRMQPTKPRRDPDLIITADRPARPVAIQRPAAPRTPPREGRDVVGARPAPRKVQIAERAGINRSW